MSRRGEPRCGLPSCSRRASFASASEAGVVVLCSVHRERLERALQDGRVSKLDTSRRLAEALAGGRP